MAETQKNALRLCGLLLVIVALILALIGLFKNNETIFNPPKKAPAQRIEAEEPTNARPDPPEKVKFDFYDRLLQRRNQLNEYDPKKPSPYLDKKNIRSFRVQIGAFKEKKQAEALLTKMKKAGHEMLMVQGKGYWLVQIVNLKDEKTARALAKKLKEQGMDTVVKQYE